MKNLSNFVAVVSQIRQSSRGKIRRLWFAELIAGGLEHLRVAGGWYVHAL